MAEKGSIAKAFVQIVPSADGLSDGIEKELNKSLGKTGGKAGKTFLSGLGKTFAKGIGVASAAIGTGIVKVAKDSVQAYAENEQLAGGTKLLFGDAYSYVMEQASSAYATLQMSENDYLKQVNGLSTSLKTALGGDAQAAAELANRVVTAEADVVAATGAEQEAVQNAFNGIIKGNYTMLDNLQLGITPTKEGFQAMIDSVNKYNKEHGKATDYQISNLADAEAALVDYVAMQGLAGYAATEGADTIQGSLSSFKAAWQNLLVGFASGENIFGLVTDLGETVGNLAKNIAPVITQTLEGIFLSADPIMKAVGQLLPNIADTVLTNLPSLAKIAIGAITTISNGLISLMPQIATTGLDILKSLIEGGTQAIPGLIGTISTILPTIVKTLTDDITPIINAGTELIVALAQGLPTAIPAIVEAIPEIIAALITAVISAAPQLLTAAGELMLGLIEGIVNTVKDFEEVGGQLIMGLVDGIVGAAKKAWESIKEVCSGLLKKAKDVLGIKSPSKEFRKIGGFVTEGFADGIMQKQSMVDRSIAELASNASLQMQTSFNAPRAGSGTTINITAKQLSQADIDYVIGVANSKLGALA